MSQDSETTRILSDIVENSKTHFIKRQSQSSPFTRINCGWEDYLKSMSKKQRYKLRRASKALSNAEITIYTDKDIDKAIDEVIEISKNSWKYDEGISIANAKDNSLFYRQLAKEFAAKGWLTIWVLKIQSKPVSFNYDIIFNSKIFALLSGYDKSYAEISTGEHLNAISLKYYFNSNFNEYDWMGENNEYKMHWTSEVRPHIKYFIYKESVWGLFLYLFESIFANSARYLFKRQAITDLKFEKYDNY